MQSPAVTLILTVAAFVIATVLLIIGSFRLRARGGAEPLSLQDKAWVGVPLVVALLAAAAAGQAYRTIQAAAPTPTPGTAHAPAAPAAGDAASPSEATGAATPSEATGAVAPAVEPAAGGTLSPEAVAAPGADAQLAQGKTIYQTNCASCHQTTGLGLPGAFPPIAGAEVPNGPAEAHIKIVLDGQTGPITVKGQPYNSSMPAWKATLTAEQIAAVVTYERVGFGNKGGSVTTEDVVKLGGR